MKRFFCNYSTGSNHSSHEIHVSNKTNALNNHLKTKGGRKIFKKTIYSFSGMFSCLLMLLMFIFTSAGQAQEYSEFAPIGAEWYYIDGHGSPFTSLFHYVVTGDTIIEDQPCKIITVYSVDSNTVKETLIIKNDQGKIYYLFNNEFYLIYDYTANIGDTLNLICRYRTHPEQMTDSIFPFSCKVQNIVDIEIDGQILKEYQTVSFVSLSESGWFNYNYIEKIGDRSEFIYTNRKYFETADVHRYLRCYIESELTIKTDWWKNFGFPCNYLPDVSISNIYNQDNYCIYPNPFSNSFTISLKDKDRGILFIKDILGKIVYQSEIQEGNNIIDVSSASLMPSIYFVELELEKIKVKPIKIIKK
jgi:hypothetical protein